MEDRKIQIKINNTNIEISSNNPDLKKLVDTIIAQSEDYDYDQITVSCDDSQFDGSSFKNIIIESIKDFKNNLKIDDITKKDNLDIIKSNSNVNNLDEK